MHPMASVLPAALAAAELRGGLSGAELIVAGSHRRRGISLPALGLPHEQGFAFSALQPLVVLVPSQPPGVCLVLTTGRWRQLSPGKLAQVSGTMQAHAEGSPLLPVQVAFNARAALQSCELAALAHRASS